MIEPAWSLVDLGDNRLDSEWQDVVAEETVLGIEHLALPGEEIDHGGDLIGKGGARRNDRRAFGFTIGDGPASWAENKASRSACDWVSH